MSMDQIKYHYQILIFNIQFKMLLFKWDNTLNNQFCPYNRVKIQHNLFKFNSIASLKMTEITQHLKNTIVNSI